MDTAKLFRNGQSQAVRLPKAYRFEGDRVVIKRLGNAVVLMPFEDPWRILEEALEGFTPDFMKNRRQPRRAQRRDKAFE
jgi:antitoxin VapB